MNLLPLMLRQQLLLQLQLLQQLLLLALLLLQCRISTKHKLLLLQRGKNNTKGEEEKKNKELHSDARESTGAFVDFLKIPPHK